MDATAQRAAIGCLYPDARQAEMTLTMQPLQRVVVTIDDSEINSKGLASQQTAYFGLMVDSALLIQRETKQLGLAKPDLSERTHPTIMKVAMDKWQLLAIFLFCAVCLANTRWLVGMVARAEAAPGDRNIEMV